ncbi:hypothetical protein H112_00606 [Trichophyton rubrum D6]|uniref:Uncharacterized protein n=3 Tax=Trichophyton TaxID=5550 RepID=F2T081_TRIRC|nr:uncharacterized protein TERG_08219 [Trichophyton rubrum CBS 118892]EZF27512.1 hypothetical protein H100_00605 [Trichophyton rubrum MR850]EZF46451.1 hypothetical protein H102_00605 [Trichophyton rubrum CBS 100081]EZF57199.1 hypothetical protein H103_00606 [Trichophyton rubrum CBS 288.86]EZF67768.1 hypothetical protein H104_00594 [Trichophyton rubrum CBS 289.86]EZF78441.1 hypothetical protein H105_00593 [Trichophyton soudanense CBS 452.61]EZF88999.1 hypothetical protein H110_00611 [Trichophy
MSTINIVRYFFQRGVLPKNAAERQGLIALAYQTARDKGLYPKAILIRSGLHKTTGSRRKARVDPLGWNITMSSKDSEQCAKNTHVTSHGYVKGKFDLQFIGATHAGEKIDSWKKFLGKAVWPPQDQLVEVPLVAYN